MIYGRGSIGAELGGNSEWVLGFNEPALEGQANIDPEEGAWLWRNVESAYPDRKLTTPCVLRLWWLSGWWAAYESEYGRSPRADAVCVHCYSWDVSSGRNAALDCQRRLADAIAWGDARGIGEVWLAEYAFLPCWGMDRAMEYLREMAAYFKITPQVTRYAWFQLAYRGDESWGWGPDCNTSLVDWDGRITELGRAYQEGSYSATDLLLACRRTEQIHQ